ncbi:MAG: HD domain-containing protein [Acidimicrobiia bacterium]|nr:HD domain-containing protein [Acidimicrobiia bacterium]
MAELRLRTLTFAAWTGLLVGAAAFTISGVSQTAVGFIDWFLPVLVWATAITVVSIITVPAPSGSHLSLGIGAAVGAAILVPDHAALGAAICLGLAATGLVERGLSMTTSRSDGDFLTDAIGMAAYAFSYRFVFEAFDVQLTLDPSWTIVASVAVAGTVWFVIRALVAALVGLERSDLAGRYLWLLALEDWAVVVSIFAAGALFGLTWPLMGAWAFAVAILPYAFGHLAFERYHSTRVTYGQTIRALAQIPEVAGLAPSGHSTRTADLAIAIAQEMGLHPNEVMELEYAALMHDVGRITLNEPAIVKAGYTDEDIARWGSQIIAEAPYLEHVSTLVAQQHRPYRSPGVAMDPDVPIASKIIKVASAYDDARIEMGLSPIESLERIHQGSAYEYDPHIGSSLRRVLVFRGEITF